MHLVPKFLLAGHDSLAPFTGAKSSFPAVLCERLEASTSDFGILPGSMIAAPRRACETCRADLTIHPIVLRMRRETVVLGLLGTTLDASPRARWERWRPTVDLCRREDFLVDRLELLHQPQYQELADTVARDIASVSPETRVRTHALAFPDPWDFESVFATLLDFAHAYPFKPESEDYLVHITTGTHVQQICLYLLTEARYLPGKLLQTSPPTPANSGEPGDLRVIDLDLASYRQIAERVQAVRSEGLSFLKAGIATRNPGFNALIEQVERVATATRSPILLTGPTGAGKTRLARKIFELKQARHQIAGRFVELNCATLRGDAAMSAMFGHTRGAFTGAVRERPGVLKSADNGVLFLDEIGELGLDEQAMLLRALEDRVFLPVGSDREVSSDFQLIAGTNRDLGGPVCARAASATTCWRASTSGPSACPRCASARRTSSRTSTTSSSATPSATAGA